MEHWPKSENELYARTHVGHNQEYNYPTFAREMIKNPPSKP